MFKAKFTLADNVFRQLLKDLRAEKKLTQRQLARRLKVPQSYVSKYETGERRLDFVETVYVCRAMETSIEDFVKLFSERLAKLRPPRGHANP
jgi:transcriptional regulator with XRE-family HTH domain